MEQALGRMHSDTIIEVLARCDLVIEAAPEDLALKRDLFDRLARVCRPEAVLATNTSSLSVTAIAAEVPRPESRRRDALLQPARPDESWSRSWPGTRATTDSLDHATEVARRMGRTADQGARRDRLRRKPVRPALHARGAAMLGEGVASHEEIDRICRLGGGFRMGPFELMDLIGDRRQLRGRALLLRAVLRRASLAAPSDPVRAGRLGPAGTEVRPRLLPVREGQAAPRAGPGRRGASLRSSTTTSCWSASRGRSARSCWAGSRRRSPTRRASRSARASPRPTTSTPRCSSASTGRSARSSGETGSAGRGRWGAWRSCERLHGDAYRPAPLLREAATTGSVPTGSR